MVKAIIFDFNGTLFFDTDIHYLIWQEIYQEITNKDNFTQVMNSVHGTTNLDIIKRFFKEINKKIDDEEVILLSKEKERRYREYVINNNLCNLVDGAEALFDFLKENNYLLNISSASIKENIDFFFDEFGLDRWFKKELVTYDDGTFVNKKEMYNAAAKNINTSISKCMIFEDSNYGYTSAYDAGCRNIVLINHNNKNNKNGVIAYINNFNEFDYSLLNK